ncbi:CLUMA_CG015829, isoform A [Clunio marinus]|uniref:Mediator of RNA polymerase II transcription subunit 1 n=1 Tax=Clunio marinus TaxID=568069 RepID=A0A1J1IUE4_9DIPT|nr:CLUMA_CG015829, isoform A [Clunio marinus]
MENKKWKHELLMENLRAKSSRSLMEIAKSTRLNLLERRFNIDAVEKQTLQNALDNLQNNIQVKNRAHLIERLESITRRSLLKFTDNANTNSCFISSDMFYLEILLDPQSGKVNDVKVHHECSNESQSEPHLIDVLRKGDFIDFTQQLEGFQSIYQLNAESKIKSKAYIAIQALENDLLNIFGLECMQMQPESMVLNSSLGLAMKRQGGHPLKLLFFIRPTELLNLEMKRMDSLTDALQTANFAKRIIGNSVSINLEAAAPSNKLQITSLLIKNVGKSDAHYNFNPINLHNSTMLPATFVLRLNQAMPVSTEFIDEIKKITNNLGVFGDRSSVKLENSDDERHAPGLLISMIVNSESQGLSNNAQKGLFVTLADQSHCYFISDNPEMTGTIVKSIQFTEPSHVIKIVKMLRQQAFFNALIASCVRKPAECPNLDCFIFEVNVVSMSFIQVIVEHPIEETIVTVELDISDIRRINVKINGSEHQFDSKLENYILRVFQKTMSIPMILRSLIKYWENKSQDFQRLQKKVFNNEFYDSTSDPKRGDTNEKKDERERNSSSGTIDASYNGNGSGSGSVNNVSGAFDICGTNKNEIFFKTANDQSKQVRHDLEVNIDIFDQQRTSKMSRGMAFDLNDENDDLIRCNLMTEDMLIDNSPSPMSSNSSGDVEKNLIFQAKNRMPSQKSLDVFEFNDPSPPPAVTVIPPLQSPLAEERSKKVPTPRASPSTISTHSRVHDIEIIPLKSQSPVTEPSMLSHGSISIHPINNFYEKPKSEKKKKRKREDGDMGSPAAVKKKLSDSLGSSMANKSSGSGGQLLGKPSASFKPKKSPARGLEGIDDSTFMNFGAEQTITTVTSPLPSPQSLLKNSSSAQVNRKSSLSAVINKLKSEMSDAIATSHGDEKKGEYQIKSSGSDGIKITFNKTKSSKSPKSPKHTGLKPGVNSGPASKKSSQSHKSSSQKLLYQKSNSSGSLNPQTFTMSPKSSSQPSRSSSKERSKEGSVSPMSGFAGTSNDMLKNMLKMASTGPRPDVIKSFDKNFQIPKLSSRGKSDEKTSFEDNFKLMHPRSAPTTPVHHLTPSPTLDFMRDGGAGGNLFQPSMQNSFLTSNQQLNNKSVNQNKKLFKSVSSEHLPGEENEKFPKSSDSNDNDFQTFLRAQSKMNDQAVSMQIFKSIDLGGNMTQSGGNLQMNDSMFNDDDLSFIRNEM